MNETIAHNPIWPPMPTNIPLDIPKFEGKQAEDPGNHVVTFHLWCSSNSIVDDTIRLRLFQCTLTGVVAKWYVEQPSATHGTFSAIATTFLTYFKLPIHHDSGMELLNHFRQTPVVHISNHLHEWQRHRSLCKAKLDNRVLLDLFLKNLTVEISNDVAHQNIISEEDTISKAQ